MPKPSFIVPDTWIAKYLEPRYPELVEPYRDAAQRTADAFRDGALADSDLARLVDDARHPARMMGDAAIDMLGRLAAVFPAAMREVEVLSGDAKAVIRERAVAATLYSAPAETHERIYTAALADKSKRVREVAAQCIRQQRMVELADALDAARDRERDAATASYLTRELERLRGNAAADR